MVALKNDGPSGTERLWQVNDVVAYLRIGKRKFYYLRAQGAMIGPVAQLGRSLLFHPQEVRDWVRAGTPPLAVWAVQKKLQGN